MPIDKLRDINRGHDAANTTPAPTDIRIYRNLLVETFFSDPPIIRKLAPFTATIDADDGHFGDESYTMDDMKDAQVAMEPGVTSDEIKGTPVTAPIVAVYKGATMSDIAWNRMFATRDRRPLIESGLLRKIGEQEETIAFRGNTKTGLTGLVSGASVTTPAATTLGYEGNSDGVLTNFRSLIQYFINDLSDLNIHIGPKENGGIPLDVVVNWPLWNKAATTFLSDTPSVNNVQLLEQMLGGGKLMASNWTQASVTTASCTALALPRLPQNKMAWYITASNFKIEPFRPAPFHTSINVFERFSIKILQPTFIRYASSLSTASA